MTQQLNPTQHDMLSMLRGSAGDRPTLRAGLRTELRETLESALSQVSQDLTVTKGMLRDVHQCEGKFVAPSDFSWNPRNARGTVAHVAIELSVGGRTAVTPMRLVEDALGRICERPEQRSLADYIRRADEAERAELRVSAVDLVTKFLELFPPIKDNWRPVAESSTAAHINGRVLLRGKIDMKLGMPDGNRSGALLIDFKTGSPSFSDIDDLRFYALLETLRTGTAPFKWANVYLDMGRADEEVCTEAVLWSALARTADAVAKINGLKQGEEPRLTPGVACRFCPANDVCESSAQDEMDA